MRIVQEKVDREQFLELRISEKELQLLKEYMMVSTICFVHGEVMRVGIKLELGEDYDEQ